MVVYSDNGGFNTAAARGNFVEVRILYSFIAVPLFTARCYTEHGYATLSRLSVCLSVCDLDVCFFHTGWNTSKIISQINSLRYLLRLTPTWAT